VDRPLESGWLSDTPHDDTLLRSFVQNQIDVNGLLAEHASGGRSDITGDVGIADANGPVPYYNQAILRRPVLDAGDPVLDLVEDFFGPTVSSGRPATLLSIWPTPDLSSRGWHLVGHPAFVARPAGPHSPVAAPTVEVGRLGPDEIGTFERVMVEGYPLPEAAGLPPGSLVPPGAVAAGITLRSAVVDGAPVAVGMGYVGSGVVNLCGGATLEAARRRGAWGALVWARVDDAPDLPAVAFTSDFSRPGFLHMGFLVITRFSMWFRPPG
jgi:hypothetical protein